MSAAALVAALRAPIDQLRVAVAASVGVDGTASVLSAAGTTLSHIGSANQQAWDDVFGAWTGGAATQAGVLVTQAGQLVERLADSSTRLLTAARGATDSVSLACRELEQIADQFTAAAQPLAERLPEPEAAQALAALTRQALTDAVAVVDRLRAELDGHTQLVTGSAPAATVTSWGTNSAPAATMPAGWSAETPSYGDLGKTLPHFAEADFGDGVAVTLPDGTTVTAPNALAASAVRHALTQLGVPYHWGGTTPGVGLDCSGLTQWAYSEAGLELPRLAQTQDVGAQVSASALLPGDLAVWDGHVAMVVGDGMMIEAGDPVQLSPVRTTNSGQGFQGFWRPTA